MVFTTRHTVFKCLFAAQIIILGESDTIRIRNYHSLSLMFWPSLFSAVFLLASFDEGHSSHFVRSSAHLLSFLLTHIRFQIAYITSSV